MSPLLLLVRDPPPVPDPAPFDPPRIEERRLESGAELWVLERHEIPLVRLTVQVAWAGARAPTREQLLAGMATSLLGSGTESRDGAALWESFDAVGASWGIGLSGERLWAFVEVPTGMEEQALDLLAETFFAPLYPASDLRRERRLWVEWRRELEWDIRRVHDRALNHAWFPPGHPGRLTASEADIRRLDAKGARALVDEVRAGGRPSFVAVGDISPARAQELLESRFGALEGKNEAVFTPVVQARPTFWLVDRDGFDVAELGLMMPGPAEGTRELAATRVLSLVMAEAFTSRMNLDLREERGLTYGVWGEVEAWGDSSRVSVGAEVQGDRAVEALLAMETHIERLIDEGITPEELRSARNTLLVDSAAPWRSASGTSAVLGRLLLLHRDLDWLRAQTRAVAELTVEAVNAAADRVLDRRGRVWVITGDREALEPALEAAGRVPERVVSSERLSAEP